MHCNFLVKIEKRLEENTVTFQVNRWVYILEQRDVSMSIIN